MHNFTKVLENIYSSISFTDAFTNSTLTVSFIMIFLAFLSVSSWAVIIYKFILFRKGIIATEQFGEMYWKNSDYSSVVEKISFFSDSPVAMAFKKGVEELNEIKKIWSDKKREMDLNAIETIVADVKRAMFREGAVSVQLLENKMTLLSTTAAVSPFLGLFGTVWGIMNAFDVIGKTGTATLGTIAPSLSEALVTTAAGLIAAIPAAIFYNYLGSKIQKFESEISNVASDFTGRVRRELL